MSADDLRIVKDALHRIEKAIVGDSEMGHKGIADRLNDVEAKTDAMDKKLIRWGGVLLGASVVIEHLKTKLFG